MCVCVPVMCSISLCQTCNIAAAWCTRFSCLYIRGIFENKHMSWHPFVDESHPEDPVD